MIFSGKDFFGSEVLCYLLLLLFDCLLSTFCFTKRSTISKKIVGKLNKFYKNF